MTTTSKGKGAALITGAGRRIGRAIALHLASQGHDVAVHYRQSREEAEQVAGEARRLGVAAVAVAADLAAEDEVIGLIPAAVAALGPLSVLVNNASVFDYDTALTATRAGWDRHLEVNLRAPFVLIQAFAAQVPPGPDGNVGNVVNLIDQRVWHPGADFTTYTLSKAGLWTLTQTLALALAPQIRVNAIGPGPVLPSPRQSHEHFAAQVAGLPLPRAVEPGEIARAVSFILATPSLTGQMIALDGGQHLGGASSGIE